MPITVYSDVILPDSVISAGVSGKNMRMNSRIAMNNGYESINQIWARTLRQYQLGIKPMSLTAWQAIQAIHEITEGGAYGFLMEDPSDCQVSGGVATSLTSTTFQLKKRYTDAGSSRTKDRNITRPRSSGFTITTSGTPIVSYTLDVTTGIITIPAAPSAATLAWSGKYYVPVHFQEDFIDWEIVMPGADAGRLLAGPSVVLQEIRE